jgi:hypothetical protein
MSCGFKGGVSAYGGPQPKTCVRLLGPHNARGIVSVWRKIRKQLGLGIIVAIGLTLPAFGQSGKVPDGIYQLNYEKSSIRGPIAKSQTVQIGPGDINTIIGIGLDGKPYTMIDTGIVDGKPHPITGSPNYDMTTRAEVHL